MQVSEAHDAPTLVTERIPVGPEDTKKSKTDGDRAVTDALIIVLLAWAVLFFLIFTLRRHNI